MRLREPRRGENGARGGAREGHHHTHNQRPQPPGGSSQGQWRYVGEGAREGRGVRGKPDLHVLGVELATRSVTFVAIDRLSASYRYAAVE